MEITAELVGGYVGAVAAALEAAGHQTDVRIAPDDRGAEIALPGALTDDAGPAGLVLSWATLIGWTVSVWNQEADRVSGHQDLKVAEVPAPEVLVRAVAAVVETGQLRSAVPDTAELLAAYAAGAAPDDHDAEAGEDQPAAVTDGVLWERLRQMDTLQRSVSLSFAQHLRMARLYAAIAEAETAPEWTVAKAQLARAHAAIAELLRDRP